MRGVEVSLSEGEELHTRDLVVRLLDPAHRDIFYQLCHDIILSTGDATSESEAVKMCLVRTWRWHHLLRGGGPSHLTTEEQKGLIGELIVLETMILPIHAISDPVTTWRGPLGSPKDFEIGQICIEAKARRGAATPYILISSEHQLDTTGVGVLFLYVSDLALEQSTEKEAFTLTEMARQCRRAVSARDMGSVELFETRLAATGFRWEDDYTASRWTQGAHRAYRVVEGFPRLSASSCVPGVSNVRYSLALGDCEPFLVTRDEVVSALDGRV
jgi:hypothetical protein